MKTILKRDAKNTLVEGRYSVRRTDPRDDHEDIESRLQRKTVIGLDEKIDERLAFLNSTPWRRQKRTELALDLRRQGKTIAAIAAELQCSPRRIYQILAEAGG